ncbi:molybdenum cofactor guanylyltransferase MobA [Xenophilus azovorans]|uniref:molybdenum cofactor guanylyltransferase MobA n=1 Tax=Xenophilus azovorans TaxID=151755 RepID=UPI000570140C|nr:molybdenum cofactor guanylyltransferase MobA [Xenophilus azovorans]
MKPEHITGLVLAGGLGTRMGGADKGLVPWQGRPLAVHALERLRPQVGALAINANRHQSAYATFGVPVWPDTVAGHPGPLAGFLAGMAQARTDWLLTVPCDTPRFPPDLARRLGEAVLGEGADLAVAAALEDGTMRPQPVFCLMRTSLHASLARFVAGGGRKVGQWVAECHGLVVPFDRPGDAGAFANANTPQDLQALGG